MFFLDSTSNGNRPHDRGRGIMKLDESDHVDGSALSLDEVRQQVQGAPNQGRGAR